MKKSALFTRLLPALLLACALLAAPQDIRAQGPDPVVKLETSMGDILVRLDARKAPMTTANFLEYVKAGSGNLVFNGKELTGETGIAFGDSIENATAYTGKLRVVVEDYTVPGV